MINLTELEKNAMLSFLNVARQYSDPAFPQSSCETRQMCGLLNSLLKKGIVAHYTHDKEWYVFTAEGLCLAKQLGMLEPIKHQADWLYEGEKK